MEIQPKKSTNMLEGLTLNEIITAFEKSCKETSPETSNYPRTNKQMAKVVFTYLYNDLGKVIELKDIIKKIQSLLADCGSKDVFKAKHADLLAKGSPKWLEGGFWSAMLKKLDSFLANNATINEGRKEVWKDILNVDAGDSYSKGRGKPRIGPKIVGIRGDVFGEEIRTDKLNDGAHGIIEKTFSALKTKGFNVEDLKAAARTGASVNFDESNNVIRKGLGTTNQLACKAIIAMIETQGTLLKSGMVEVCLSYSLMQMEEEASSIEHSSDNENNSPSYSFGAKAENKIFYGVPGSGKSFSIKKAIKEIVRKDGRMLSDEEYGFFEKVNTMRLVFYPDYSYSDFIGQILPISKSGNIKYDFIAGPFTRILALAFEKPNEPYFLIIEEINRGNAAAIFGDIFQLLDRTDGESEYGIKNIDIAQEVFEDEYAEIRLPKNLWIFATMNTSDQNVFTLDTAFQRRFEMELIENKFSVEHEFEIDGTGIAWRTFAETINDILAKQDAVVSSEDKSLGAWFIKSDEIKDGKKFVSKKRFANKVIKYLWDDAFKFARNDVFDISENKNTLQKVISAFETGGFDVILKESVGIKNVAASIATNNESEDI